MGLLAITSDSMHKPERVSPINIYAEKHMTYMWRNAFRKNFKRQNTSARLFTKAEPIAFPNNMQSSQKRSNDVIADFDRI